MRVNICENTFYIQELVLYRYVCNIDEKLVTDYYLLCYHVLQIKIQNCYITRRNVVKLWTSKL